MKPKLNFIFKQLEKIKNDDLYRQLRSSRVLGAHITIGNKKLLNLCSNDYLGMPVTKLDIKQMQSSSRLVSGNDSTFNVLERKLAKHKSQQNALIFPTGYMANLGAITALIQKNDQILSDEYNHASIIEACRLTDAKITIYKHNDVYDLQSKISKKHNHRFIITEGIFSMDGDFAKLNDIIKIAKQDDAITILDDAHGDFVVGDDGRGTADHFNVSKKIDLYISSLSKGLGSFGGYVAANNSIIQLCINKAKSFIYTSALPSFFVEYSLKRFNSNREKYQIKLNKNIKYLSSGLKKIGYDISSDTHIIPIIVGSEKIALDFGKYLYKNGIFAQPIRFPTVPKNKARVRISVTGWLTSRHIENVLSVFDAAKQKFDIF